MSACENSTNHSDERGSTPAAQPTINGWMHVRSLAIWMKEGRAIDWQTERERAESELRGVSATGETQPALADVLVKLADEIERTIFYREIDVLETDTAALRHQIASYIRSKAVAAEPPAERTDARNFAIKTYGQNTDNWPNWWEIAEAYHAWLTARGKENK